MEKQVDKKVSGLYDHYSPAEVKTICENNIVRIVLNDPEVPEDTKETVRLLEELRIDAVKNEKEVEDAN